MNFIGYALIYEFAMRCEYGNESHKHKYNWQFSTHGGYTSTKMVRRSSWQLGLVIL